MSRVKWTAIVLTCSFKEWTHTLQQELEARQAKGQIDDDVILLTVEDPKTDVGSGGATINALLTVVEHISVRQGFTAINHDVLTDARILILHNGRSYSYDPCGRPFTTLPAKFASSQADGLVCNVDILLKLITEKIAVGAPPGVWISSLDSLIAVPEDADLSWQPCDVCMVTMPVTPAYARNHGVCKTDEQGMVEDVLHKEDEEATKICLRPDGMVPVVCSIVYLSTTVSEKLLSFYTKPPLNACTYFGLDSGQAPMKLSLFFDILLPMTTDISQTDFVQGDRSDTFGKPGQGASDSRSIMITARKLLWKELHGYRIKTLMIERGIFHHLEDIASDHMEMLLRCPIAREENGLKWAAMTQADVKPEVQLEKDVTVINSVLQGHVTVGSKTVICHSLLQGNIAVGKDSFINGVSIENLKPRERIQFADNMMVQGFHIHLQTLGATRTVLTVLGRHDNVQALIGQKDVTFCNEPWLGFLNRTGIRNEDLWGTDVVAVDRTVHNAKLFPVFHTKEEVGQTEILWLQGQMTDTPSQDILRRWKTSWRLSLAEILMIVDVEATLATRKSLFYKVAEFEVERVLTNCLDQGLNNLYTSAAVDGFSHQMLDVLDRVASRATSPSIIARIIGNIADVLGCMAGKFGGVRSGPAANQSWKKAFSFLENKDLAQGVAALAEERSKWMSRSDHLIRAARHYEGACQILIRQAVMTAKEYFVLGQGELPPFGKWVQAATPCRIDVSGGWSDTPPICFEHGGAVTTVGLLINGKRPIGCKVRRIKEPIIRMELVSNGEVICVVVCKELSDLEDYFNPHAPGAILKGAFVCCDMLDMTSSSSLADQLTSRYGGGFEMQSWSNLPHGSGMGTSSILAGTVLAALLSACGKTYETKGIIHAVLYLEQLHTTGGGWQDQVGGLMGGFHMGVSPKKLPLNVDPVYLKVSPETVEKFNSRMLLVYTGQTRLARNLIQDVVRSWYSRNPWIISIEDALVDNAKECSAAFMAGDIDRVGKCVADYWEMKKWIAPGSESQIIALIAKTLQPYTVAVCCPGAGGGGFVFGVLKNSQLRTQAVAALEKQTGLEEVVVYEATVATTGLNVTVEP